MNPLQDAYTALDYIYESIHGLTVESSICREESTTSPALAETIQELFLFQQRLHSVRADHRTCQDLQSRFSRLVTVSIEKFAQIKALYDQKKPQSRKNTLYRRHDSLHYLIEQFKVCTTIKIKVAESGSRDFKLQWPGQ